MKRSALKIHPAEDAGYLVLAALAKDNLLLGYDVIVDTVNPIEITRKMWGDCANEANATLIDVEVVCTSELLHRKRVETRMNDIDGLIAPSWKNVTKRQFEPWMRDRIIVDTSNKSASECAAEIITTLR